MRGTLAEGDGVWISPVDFHALQKGDVVGFEAGGRVMVHRIVGWAGAGAQTQGDGNWRRDPALLMPGQLIGKVTDAERGGKRFPVAGGAVGYRRAALLHGRAFLRWMVLSLLNIPYRLVRASRIVSWLWRPRIVAARFTARPGTITKFIHQGRTVARWLPHDERWECRKPYDLVLAPPRR